MPNAKRGIFSKLCHPTVDPFLHSLTWIFSLANKTIKSLSRLIYLGLLKLFPSKILPLFHNICLFLIMRTDQENTKTLMSNDHTYSY